MTKSNQGVVASLKSLLSFGEGSSEKNATALLREDHQKVQSLFGEFGSAESAAQRRAIVNKVLKELRAHTTIEEEIFYPAVAREMKDKEHIECAFEEHGIAKHLIEGLEGMEPDDEGYNAKFKVLGESVGHHIREEESQILPSAESSDLDLDALGREMLARKQALLEKGGWRGRGHKRTAGRRVSRGRAKSRSVSAQTATGSVKSRGLAKLKSRKSELATSARKRAKSPSRGRSRRAS